MPTVLTLTGMLAAMVVIMALTALIETAAGSFEPEGKKKKQRPPPS